jgi:hypothetical protein
VSAAEAASYLGVGVVDVADRPELLQVCIGWEV